MAFHLRLTHISEFSCADAKLLNSLKKRGNFERKKKSFIADYANIINLPQLSLSGSQLQEAKDICTVTRRYYSTR